MTVVAAMIVVHVVTMHVLVLVRRIVPVIVQLAELALVVLVIAAVVMIVVHVVMIRVLKVEPILEVLVQRIRVLPDHVRLENLMCAEVDVNLKILKRAIL
jgi:hypothetical protein